MKTLRTIIAGSRNVIHMDCLLQALKCIDWTPITILSGTACGADRLGEQWAKLNNIPLELYPADWNKYKKRAGYLRNAEMAENAEALIALWDGESKGTKHMIDLARKKGLIVYVFLTGIK